MKILNYIKLLQKYNTLKIQYEALTNNFKNSAYKHILDFEGQQRQIEDLIEKNTALKKENAILKKDEKRKRAIEDLKERRSK